MDVEKPRQRTQTVASARKKVEAYDCPKFEEGRVGGNAPPHV